MKALAQIDFTIATAMFILIFAFLAGFTTDYFTSMKNDIVLLERKATLMTFLQSLLDYGLPENWHTLTQTYENSTTPYYARSFDRSNNATIAVFSSGELSQIDDESYACIVNKDGANAMEVFFPNLSLPPDALVGTVKFAVRYNSTYFETSSGAGDWKDDFLVLEQYLSDWGGNVSVEWIWWYSGDASTIVDEPNEANSLKVTLYYKPTGPPSTACIDFINASVKWSLYPYYPRRLGLAQKLYEVMIIVNNSLPYYKTPATEPIDLISELVTVDFDWLGYEVDLNSTEVIDSSGNPVPCSVDHANDAVNFSVSIAAGEVKRFVVRFMADSNFSQPRCNATIAGEDNLTEMRGPLSYRKVIGYRKLMTLGDMDYGVLKSAIGVEQLDFNITLLNESRDIYFSFGKDLPRIEEIYSLEAPVVFQDAFGELHDGVLRLYLWKELS